MLAAADWCCVAGAAVAGSDNCWRAGPGSGTALLAASAQPGRRGGTAAALSCPDHCTHHLLELAGEMELDSSDIQVLLAACQRISAQS